MHGGGQRPCRSVAGRSSALYHSIRYRGIRSCRQKRACAGTRSQTCRLCLLCRLHGRGRSFAARDCRRPRATFAGRPCRAPLPKEVASMTSFAASRHVRPLPPLGHRSVAGLAAGSPPPASPPTEFLPPRADDARTRRACCRATSRPWSSSCCSPAARPSAAGSPSRFACRSASWPSSSAALKAQLLVQLQQPGDDGRLRIRADRRRPEAGPLARRALHLLRRGPGAAGRLHRQRRTAVDPQAQARSCPTCAARFPT